MFLHDDDREENECPQLPKAWILCHHVMPRVATIQFVASQVSVIRCLVSEIYIVLLSLELQREEKLIPVVRNEFCQPHACLHVCARTRAGAYVCAFSQP